MEKLKRGPVPKAKPKCLIAGCGSPSKGRGVCHRCLMGAYNLVKTGKTTWEELEKMGLVLSKGASSFTTPLCVKFFQLKGDEPCSPNERSQSSGKTD